MTQKASKTFTDDVKRLFKGQSPNPYKIWKQMDSPDDIENISYYCVKLFQNLSLSSKEQVIDEEHEAMYSTLFVLEFYKNTSKKPQAIIKESKDFLQSNKGKVYEHAAWVVDLFLNNSEEMLFALNFISQICHLNKKISWKVEPGHQFQQALEQAELYSKQIQLAKMQKMYRVLEPIAFDQKFPQTKIIAFSYCCFIDYLKSANYIIKKKVWTHVMDLLKALVHSMRVTLKTQRILFDFLHLIKILIKFNGCTYDDILKQMIYWVNIIRGFPGKNGDLAFELFPILHAELKVAGTAFRKELIHRFVALNVKNADYLSEKMYLITSKFNVFSSPQPCSLNNLRKLIIFNILGCCKIDNINKLRRIIEPLDFETTYTLYYKLMKIIDIASCLETYESIHKLIKQHISQLFKMNWAPSIRSLPKQQTDELYDLIVDQNQQKFFQFPNHEIVYIKLQMLTNKKSNNSIHQIFQSTKEYPFNQIFYQKSVNFILIGDDIDLHHFINQVGEFLKNSLSVQDYQRLNVYILPIKGGNCLVSQYLASKDLWYKRFVFDVFKGYTLYPLVDFQQQLKDTFPSYLFQKTLHMYIREADRKCPFQIFKCQMMIGESNQEKIVYFITNVLIGASVQCELMKRLKDKDQKNFDQMDFYLQKYKKFNPLSLCTKIRFKVPHIQVTTKTEQRYLSVEDIQIANTPKSYFFGHKPNPLDQYLQISMLLSHSAKVFRSQMSSRQNFKRFSPIEISQAMKDLFIHERVDSIVIERSDITKQPFMRVLIDGVLYQKIDKLKIEIAQTYNKLPLTLPVKCFLPFEQ